MQTENPSFGRLASCNLTMSQTRSFLYQSINQSINLYSATILSFLSLILESEARWRLISWSWWEIKLIKYVV